MIERTHALLLRASVAFGRADENRPAKVCESLTGGATIPKRLAIWRGPPAALTVRWPASIIPDSLRSSTPGENSLGGGVAACLAGSPAAGFGRRGRAPMPFLPQPTTATVIVHRESGGWPETLRRGAVAIGNFDGLHRGHQRLVSRLRELARQVDGPSVVWTFDPHPGELLDPRGPPPPLSTLDERLQSLAESGVDGVVVYPTDRALLGLSPEAFFDTMLRQGLQVRGMVEGPNFRFGKNRAGDIALLDTLCRKAEVRLEVVEPLIEDGRTVSSSTIRQLLSAGAVDQAAGLLGRDYSVTGRVVRGAGRGRALGVPTANLAEVATLLPAHGVYAGHAHWTGGRAAAAIHLGPNATFDEQAASLEVHLLDTEADLYGQRLEVAFLKRLRGTQRFDSIEALKRQMAEDIAQTRQAAG